MIRYFDLLHMRGTPVSLLIKSCGAVQLVTKYTMSARLICGLEYLATLLYV